MSKLAHSSDEGMEQIERNRERDAHLLVEPNDERSYLDLPPEAVHALKYIISAIHHTGAQYASRGDHDGDLIANAMHDLAGHLHNMLGLHD